MVGVTWGQENSAGGGTETASKDNEVAATAAANATDTTTKRPLTGIPQIDYIHDPNLPHELRSYNLSDYPFYKRLPEDLLLPSFNFSCDNRHDGFYASVPHKCQVYHNCLFGQRYDFLCANYTVFDQKNFICHYVSEVDCANSANHYDRNDELYVTTTTTTSTQAPPQVIYVDRPRPLRGPGLVRPNRPRPFGGNQRRPGNRRTTTTPAPEYYDDYYDEYYDQYYDDYYNDYAEGTTTTTTTTQRPRRPNRPQRTRLGGGGGGDGRSRPSGRFGNIFNAKDRQRPRINPPVPSDAEFDDEPPRSSRLQQNSAPRQQAIDDNPVNEPPQDIAQETPSGPRRRRPGGKPRQGGRPQKKATTTTTTTSTTTTTETAPKDDYYYDYYEYEDEPSTTAAPARPSRPSLSRTRAASLVRPQTNRSQPSTTTTTTTTEEPRPRPNRPGRIVRKNPVAGRETPIEGAVPLDEPPIIGSPQETEPQQSRLQRFRPQFPRKRTQNEPSSGDQEAVIVEEEPPLAPGLELSPDGDLAETAVSDSVSGPPEETPSGPQASLRRIGQSGIRRLGPRVRTQRSHIAPDFYDY